MVPNADKVKPGVYDFEESTRKAIGKIKALLGGSDFDISNLSTTDKTSLINAINELKGDVNTLNQTLSNFSITITDLENWNLVGVLHTQIAYGDHDHEIGDMEQLFNNQLI